MELPERIAKMEAQVDSLKADVAEVKSDIRDLHSRITTTTREITDHIDRKIDDLAVTDANQHKAMSESINSMKERVDVLEKWRFMIVGGAIALGYLLSHLEIFGKIFK